MLVEKLKEFLKDASFYGLSNVLGQLIGFFLIPLYTAYLTPDDYGVLTLLGFYTLFYTPLSHLGLQGAMFRYVGLASSNEEEGGITSTAFKAVILFSIVTTGFSFLFLKSIQNLLLDSVGYTKLLVLVVLTAFFSSLAQFAITYLRIKRRVRSIFWLNIGNLCFSVTLNIVLIVLFKMGLAGIIYTNTIAAVLYFLVVFRISKIPLGLKFDKQVLRKLLGYGIPNVPHYMQATVMIVFGQFYLSKLMDSSDLGLYAVAWKFCLPFQAVMGIIQSSWSAYKFDLYRNSKNPKVLMGQFTMIMSLIFIALYFTTVVFGPKVLVLMTDTSFHEAQYLLPILALIPLFNSHYYIFNTGVAFGRHQYFMPVISFAGTISTVLAALLLVPSYGSIGAALATAFGWLIMCIGTFIYGQNNYSLKFRLDVIISGVILSVVFAFWIFLFEPSLIIQVFVLVSGVIMVSVTFWQVISKNIKVIFNNR